MLRLTKNVTRTFIRRLISLTADVFQLLWVLSLFRLVDIKSFPLAFYASLFVLFCLGIENKGLYSYKKQGRRTSHPSSKFTKQS